MTKLKSPKFLRSLLMTAFTLVLLPGINSSPAHTVSPPDNPREGDLICEPMPPLAIRADLEEFIPSSKGGIVTVRVMVQPRTAMGEVVISSRLQQGMTFIDGSSEMTWRLPVLTGGQAGFTAVIQVPRNGKFPVAFQAVGVLPSGQAIHRSVGVTIWAGRRAPVPHQRHDALEFRGVRPEKVTR